MKTLSAYLPAPRNMKFRLWNLYEIIFPLADTTLAHRNYANVGTRYLYSNVWTPRIVSTLDVMQEPPCPTGQPMTRTGIKGIGCQWFYTQFPSQTES